MRMSLFLASLMASLAASSLARADIITVTPADSDDEAETKLESAQAGDTVLVAPGTYHFMVYLEQTGTAAAPIVIKAQDPANRPRWDLDGTYTETAPGHYQGSDRNRGCWQIVTPAAHYEIDGIEFHNCHSDPYISGNAGGIRIVKAGSVTLRNMLFSHNDNGLIGGGDDLLVEQSEFDTNGVPTSDQQHNLYVLGGSRFTLRYSYLHDAQGGQNFHIRSHDATLEYNWFENAADYEGDLMTYSPDYDATPQPSTQKLTLRGNVIIGSQSPDNTVKLFTLANDGGMDALSMSATFEWNTIVSRSGTSPTVLQIRNDGFDSAAASFSNNILVGVASAYDLAGGDGNATVGGSRNWMPDTADSGVLSGTILGTAPGFVDAAQSDYSLAPESACIGSADEAVTPPPAFEYVRHTGHQPRASAHNLGAFEGPSNTGGTGGEGGTGGTGAGGTGGGGDTGGGGTPGTGGSGAEGGGGGSVDSPDACSCRAAGSRGEAGGGLLLLVALGVLATRRRDP